MKKTILLLSLLLFNIVILLQNSQAQKTIKLDEALERLCKSVETDEWVNSAKSECKFSDDGNKIEVIESLWDESSQSWIHTGRINYFLNVYGNEDSRKFEKWDAEEQEFIDSVRWSFTYNDDENLINSTDEVFQPNNETWTKYCMEDFTYNSDAYCTNKIHSHWDPENDGSILLDKTEYFYNENGNIDNEILYVWDEYDEKWSLNIRQEYEYTELGYKINGLMPFMAPEKLDTIIQVEYIYDENGNLAEINSYVIEFNTLELIPSSKSVFEYNIDVSFDDCLLEPKLAEEFTEFGFVNIPVKQTTYNFESEQWVIDSETIYKYSEISDEVSMIEDSFGPECKQIQIMPNPAKDYFSFTSIDFEMNTSVDIYDLIGRKVTTKKLINDKVNVASLNNGIYIIKVESFNHLYSGKIIIE